MVIVTAQRDHWRASVEIHEDYAVEIVTDCGVIVREERVPLDRRCNWNNRHDIEAYAGMMCTYERYGMW